MLFKRSGLLNPKLPANWTVTGLAITLDTVRHCVDAGGIVVGTSG